MRLLITVAILAAFIIPASAKPHHNHAARIVMSAAPLITIGGDVITDEEPGKTSRYWLVQMLGY